VFELLIYKEKGEQKLLIDSSMISWYAIIHGGMHSKEYEESSYMGMKCGRFKSQKGAWLVHSLRIWTQGLNLYQNF